MSYNEKDMEEYWELSRRNAEAREAITKRMDIIGQNGNDGLHYDQSEEALNRQKKALELMMDSHPCSDTSKYSNESCPDHYNFDIQPWDYMESLFSEEGFCGFLEGNVIKYISRWRDKNGVEDLKKAQTYLNKLIEFTDGE